jgi:hypothetical protein
MKTTTRFLTGFLAVSIAMPGFAQQPLPEAQPSPSEEMQPKLFFIWGIVFNIAFKFAMTAFSNWLTNKATMDVTNTSNLNRILLNTANATVMSLSSATPFGTKSASAPENTVLGDPVVPFKIENGKENYQGVHVAIVGFNAAGDATNIQPINADFHTGDRFKLKVIPTFDGLLVIENINPKSQRNHIYPANPGDVIALKAGVEVFVPIAKDEFFQFAENTGEEQLVVTIRDPRAFGAAESQMQANRKDEKTGSSFVQETPPGTFPVISQSLKLKHISK